MTETTLVPQPTAEQLQKRVTDAGQTPAPVTPAAPLPGAPAAPAAPVTTPPIQSAYNGPSIVDYLDSVGKPSDFGSRMQLAKENGIDNYTGAAGQNDALLQKVRGTGTPGTGGAVVDNVGGQPFGDQVADVLKQYGITPPDPSANPVAAFTDTYQQIYTNLGLDTVKGHIDTVLGQIDDIDNEYATEKDKLKSDPWISEPSRNVRLKDLANKINEKKGALSNQLTLYEKLYNSGRQDAQYIATKTLQSTHQNDTLHQQVILKAIDQVEKATAAKTAIAKTAATAAGKKPPTGAKITLSQAQSNGWPLSVVGMSQEEIASSFNEQTPPSWFVDKLQNERGQTMIPSAVSDMWQTYRQKFLQSSSAGKVETTASTPKNPTAKVIGDVNKLKSAGATPEDINAYIEGSGYDPNSPAFNQ